MGSHINLITCPYTDLKMNQIMFWDYMEGRCSIIIIKFRSQEVGC